MDPDERDKVEGEIADLTAQLERIREAYVGGAANEETAPPERPSEPPVAPPPPVALRPPAPPAAPAVRVPSQAESIRASIAIFVVFFGLGAIVFAWFTMGIDDAQRLAAILLGIIATVVGYYFGQRGATRAQVQAAYAMRGWQTAEARARQLEDWAQRRP